MTETITFRTKWMDALLATPNDSAHGSIDAFARAVAFAVFHHMNTDGYARPGTRLLAAQAGVSHPLVEGRVKVLEDAGFLTVTRRRGAANEYRGTIPESAQPRNVRCAPETENGSAQPRNRATNVAHSDEVATAQPRNQSAQPRNVRCPEPRTTSSTSSRTTVTRERIWATMAERELDLQRQSGRPGLPPPGSRRETGYLASLREDFERQHDAKAQSLVDKLPRTDIERWIYELAPHLSQHRWGPTLAAAQVENERRQAEVAERMAALTDEDRAEGARALAAARAELHAQLEPVEAAAS